MTSRTIDSVSGLAPWRERDDFLRLQVDDDGLSVMHLTCLDHILRDVLRAHGVASPLAFLVRPLGLVLSLDRTGLPWLLGQSGGEFDAPRYDSGLEASWVMTTSIVELREVVAALLGSGRVAILRAVRWEADWIPRSPLTNPDWHVLVATALDGGHIRLLDRQPAGTYAEVRDGWWDVSEMAATADRGLAVLEYSVRPASPPSVARLAAESVRLMRPPPVFGCAGKSHGLYAIESLRELLDPTAFSLRDSRYFRLVLRWHLPACIRKYVVGNRRTLGLYARRWVGTEGGAFPHRALDACCSAWETVARAMALAARQPGRQAGNALTARIDAATRAERTVLDELGGLVATQPSHD